MIQRDYNRNPLSFDELVENNAFYRQETDNRAKNINRLVTGITLVGGIVFVASAYGLSFKDMYYEVSRSITAAVSGVLFTAGILTKLSK